MSKNSSFLLKMTAAVIAAGLGHAPWAPELELFIDGQSAYVKDRTFCIGSCYRAPQSNALAPVALMNPLHENIYRHAIAKVPNICPVELSRPTIGVQKYIAGRRLGIWRLDLLQVGMPGSGFSVIRPMPDLKRRKTTNKLVAQADW